MRAQIVFSVLSVLIILIGALIGYIVKMERRLSRVESWIEFVGGVTKNLSKVLERPVHIERDSLLRRWRGEEQPPLTPADKRRLREVLDYFINEDDKDAPPSQKLIAAINLATIDYELRMTPIRQ